MTPALWQLVEEKLAAGWSPEQISGRLLLEGQVMVGRMRIYEYVRTDPQGWWQPIQAAAAAGKETELARRPPRRAGTHSRSCRYQ